MGFDLESLKVVPTTCGAGRRFFGESGTWLPLHRPNAKECRAYLVSKFQLDSFKPCPNRRPRPRSQSHEQLVGSLAGPFVFERLATTANELPIGLAAK